MAPEKHPDPLETIEILKSVEIGIEDFDPALRARRAERLDGRAGGRCEGGMNYANLRQLHDFSCTKVSNDSFQFSRFRRIVARKIAEHAAVR